MGTDFAVYYAEILRRTAREWGVDVPLDGLLVARPDGTAGDKHDKLDVRDENLAALCQRCHLRYDIREHMANAAATRRRKREEGGQMVLIGGFEAT